MTTNATDDLTALLAAVIAHPDEDTPRLAFADELDACAPFGTVLPTPRAELIRVQCELAAMGADPPDCPALEFLNGESCYDPECPWILWTKRHDELGRRVEAVIGPRGAPFPSFARMFGADAIYAIPGVSIGVGRGFIESVSCPWSAWSAHGDGLRAQEWVPLVNLTTRPDWLSFPTRGRPGDYEYEIAGQWVPVGVVGYWATTPDERLCELLARRWPGTRFEVPISMYVTLEPRGDLRITPELLADSVFDLDSHLATAFAAAAPPTLPVDGWACEERGDNFQPISDGNDYGPLSFLRTQRSLRLSIEVPVDGPPVPLGTRIGLVTATDPQGRRWQCEAILDRYEDRVDYTVNGAFVRRYEAVSFGTATELAPESSS